MSRHTLANWMVASGFGLIGYAFAGLTCVGLTLMAAGAAGLIGRLKLGVDH